MAKKIRMNYESADMTFNDCFNKWIKFCKANNYAQQTITYYENTVHVFNKFYDKQRRVSDINEDLIQDYIIHLRESDVKDTTIKTYMGGLRTVLYYFMKCGWIVPFKVTVPKTVKRIKDIYTDEELKRLLKKPNLKSCTFANYRNWVLVNYLIGTGQRENSIVNIKIKDIDLYNGVVKLTATKNKRETLLPLSDTLVNVLEEYLKYRKGTEEDYLFCSEFGEQMTSSGMISAIKRYNRSRGVNKTSIHLFRHTFATKWVRQNNDIVKLQHILCHADLKTTQNYLNVTLEDLKDGYQQMNPYEDLMGNKKYITL